MVKLVVAYAQKIPGLRRFASGGATLMIVEA
jgi:hypothetical protein